MIATRYAVVLTLLVVVYGMLGGIGLRLWRRRHARQVRAEHPSAGSDAWQPPMSVVPQLIFVEVYVLVGMVPFCVYIVLTTPVLTSANGQFSFYGLVGGFVLFAVLFAFLDALLIRKFRRMERQRRVAENDYLH